MDQGAWGAPVQAQAPPQQQQYQQQQQPQATNTWGNMAPDPWASASNNNSGGMGNFGAPAQPAKKDDKDPFANLWS
jgi:hypothetical protein